MKTQSRLRQAGPKWLAGSLLPLLLAGLLLVPLDAFSQIRSGSFFLKVVPGARQQGIAGSATGVLDDLWSVYANPGAAGQLREWQWSAMYTRWIADIYSASFFYGQRVRTPWSPHTRFGLGINYQGVPEFDSSQRATPEASASDLLVSLSAGQPFRWLGRQFSLGTNVKYLHSRLDQHSIDAWMFDAGLLYRTRRFNFINPGSGIFDYGILSAGLSLSHVGKELTYIATGTPLPQTFRAGLAFITGTHSGLQMQLSADFRHIRDEGGIFSVGTELTWGQLFSIRGGYDFERELLSHFAFGLSMRLDDRKTPALAVVPGRNNAMRFDVTSASQNDLFERVYRGGVSHFPIAPETFRLLAPSDRAVFDEDRVDFAWEQSRDPDLFDELRYWLLVDRDSAKVANRLLLAEQEQLVQPGAGNGASLLTDLAIDGTTYTLSGLEGGDYYWAVVAYDLDNHIRFSDRPDRRVRKFSIPQPDIEIRTISFEYSPWITEDDLQGNLYIIVANRGTGLARNVSIVLFDSLLAESRDAPTSTPASSDNGVPMHQANIDELRSGAIDTIMVEWRALRHGFYQFTAEATVGSNVAEPNLANNRLTASFYTIPKGCFAAPDTAMSMMLSRVAYDIPFIPAVFFDSGATEVKSIYIRDWVLNPVLWTLAERLIRNPELSVSLKGTADPNSGETDVTLADARAAAVRDTLIELGVFPEQIVILPGEVRPARRAPADPADARWVFQERRSVEFFCAEDAEATLFDLLSFDDVERISQPVRIASAIRGMVPLRQGVVSLQNPMARAELSVSDSLQGSALLTDIIWRATKDDTTWIETDVRYTLQLIDSLDRRFQTRPQESYWTERAILRAQRVAWPLRFANTKPLYDFYWQKLISYVDMMLNDPGLHVRITGHACMIGPDAINERLSQRRADEFNTFFLARLRETHPDAYRNILTRMEAPRGRGEQRPLGVRRLDGTREVKGDNEQPLGRKLNRRIEVEFYRPTIQR